MTAQKYLKGLLVALCSWIGICVFFISTIDPYGVSPYHLNLPRVNVQKPKRVDIDRDIKPYEVLVKQPRTLFLGTSRIHQSLDPSKLDGTRFAPAYNAAIPAATIAENVTALRQYVKTDRNLKHVFFEVFLYMLIIPTNSIADNDYLSALKDLTKFNFSASAIWDSAITIIYNVRTTAVPRHIEFGGHFVQADRFEPSMHLVAQNYSQFVLGETKKAQGLNLQRATFDALKLAQDICDEHNVEITFIVTPNYPWDDYRLYSTGDWHLIRETYDELAKLRHVYTFAQVNDLTAEPVSAGMVYWYDALHFSLNVGTAMLRALAGDSKGLPPDFMLPITPETAARALRIRTDGLLAWTAKNKDFATLFDATKIAVDRDGRAEGTLDLQRHKLTVDGVEHSIVSEKTGEVQTVVHNPNDMVISGWAADTVNRIPAINIVGTVGTQVVSKWFPGTPRVDNEAIYGRSIRPSNFVMRVLGTPPPPQEIRVFALMKDGRAVQIASSHPYVTGTMVIPVTKSEKQ